jgi:hypothetical protein
VDATKRAKEEQQVVSSQNQKPYFIPRTKAVTATPPFTPLKIQKLIRDEMVEHQVKGLYYNCDEKYFRGHKFKEQNICMSMLEDVSKEDNEAPLVSMSPKTTNINPPLDPAKVEPFISLNDLIRFSTPQILKIIG